MWVDRISSLVPARLRAQYPSEMNALFLEVRDEFDDHIHDMTVRSIMMCAEDPGAAPQTSVEARTGVGVGGLGGKPLGEGRTERYHIFLQVRMATVKGKPDSAEGEATQIFVFIS